MTVPDISKLSFYVLLLSVTFAQILVVSTAENNLDSDDPDGGISKQVLAIMWSKTDELLALDQLLKPKYYYTARGLKVDAKKNGSTHVIAGDIGE